MRIATRNVVILGVSLGISGLLMYNTFQIQNVYLNEGAMHPMTYPRILLCIWMLLACIHAFSSRCISIDKAALRAVLPSIMYILFFMSFFVISTPFLGFTLSSALMLLACLRVLHYKHFFKGLCISWISALTIWFLFQKLIGFPLPVGIWTALS